MTLIGINDGVISAKYEYDPFGNTLRSEGTYAMNNVVRFSTKATDLETGLVNFGYRYYYPEIGALIEALDQDVGGVKDSAVRALVKFGPLAKDAIPVLRKSLEPSDTSVAWFSAEALGNMGEVAKDAVSDLVRVIEDTQATCIDDTAHICQYAVTALGKIGPAAKDAIPKLGPLLNHKNPYLRARLAVAIIRIDPANRDALGALEKLLKDHDVTVRRVTIWTLGDSGNDARPAKKLVRAALADSDESVRTAASSLLKIIDLAN